MSFTGPGFCSFFKRISRQGSSLSFTVLGCCDAALRSEAKRSEAVQVHCNCCVEGRLKSMEARSKSSIMVHRPFPETLTVLLRMLIRREPVGFPLISTLEDFIPETRCYQWILLTITDNHWQLLIILLTQTAYIICLPSNTRYNRDFPKYRLRTIHHNFTKKEAW